MAHKLYILVRFVGALNVREEVLGLALKSLRLDIGPHLRAPVGCQSRQLLRRVIVHDDRPGAVVIGRHSEKHHRVRQGLTRAEGRRLIQKIIGYDARGSVLHCQICSVSPATGSFCATNKDHLALDILLLVVFRTLSGTHVNEVQSNAAFGSGGSPPREAGGGLLVRNQELSLGRIDPQLGADGVPGQGH